MNVEMWAGVECTLNRVGDRTSDQDIENGHDQRLSDLQLFADLGIQKIRYPGLWEKATTSNSAQFDWSLHDERMGELRRLNLSPVVTFLHHGSGPRFTSLLDPEFPEKLSTYAGAFAARYPWIEDFTPVNEPLTTARFSCLYGFWYPHHSSDASFVRALLNQIRGTALAMEAIRKVNPRARLIQTEDLGRATGTKTLIYQCRFENARRWLTFDLLCGRLTPKHELYSYFIKKGKASAEELQFLHENPCPPDIMGINHYLLSNRFLDHRRSFYPSCFHGGNNKQRYADVGAVDSGRSEPPTPRSVFLEAWKRYGLPIAVTEAHLAGPREAQMRWLKEIWISANDLARQGVDIRAVTAWSLLGSFDWNTLCTSKNHFYESGVFDVRAPKPRPTRLAQMVQTYASGQEDLHPLLDVQGWWQGPRRQLFAPTKQNTVALKKCLQTSRPILITGGTGTLGKAFARVCETREIPVRILQRDEMDIADPESVQKVFHDLNPWAVINTAGYVKVDQAEFEFEKCFRENTTGPEILAQACALRKIPFLTFSSDLVFDGNQSSGYTESHPVAPLNVYGRSKAECEHLVLASHSESLVIRTSSFFGPWDEHNFITQTLRNLMRGETVRAVSDVRISPTYVPDLVNASLDLLIDGERGVLHLTNEGDITWSELARMATNFAAISIGSAALQKSQIIAATLHQMQWPAARPRNSVLLSERLKILPTLDNAMSRYFTQLETNLLQAPDPTRHFARSL